MKQTQPARTSAAPEGERIAKLIARAGICSRREAEKLIAEGKVSVNGKVLDSPALNVTGREKIVVNGKALPALEPTRLWRYYKPEGLVTTARDPQDRPTVFDNLPPGVPRVVSVGRLDVNTEGLLLLTNDGELARLLELPSTGWSRRYRVRAFGAVTQEQLDKLKDGIEVEGVRYGAIEATLDKVQGSNVWLTLSLKEGKNREVKRVLGALGLRVNRLIRLSYGPFQVADLEPGEARQVPNRVLMDQLGAHAAYFRQKSGEIEAAAPPRAGVKPAYKASMARTSGKTDAGPTEKPQSGKPDDKPASAATGKTPAAQTPVGKTTARPRKASSRRVHADRRRDF